MGIVVPVPGGKQEGEVSLEKVVPAVQVIVLLPLSLNPSLQDTVRTVPMSAGKFTAVVR